MPKLIESLKMTPDQNKKGLVLEEIPSGHAFSLISLKKNDIITRVNGTPVTSEDLAAKLSQAGDRIKIDFLREGQSQGVVVTFGKKSL